MNCPAKTVELEGIFRLTNEYRWHSSVCLKTLKLKVVKVDCVISFDILAPKVDEDPLEEEVSTVEALSSPSLSELMQDSG